MARLGRLVGRGRAMEILLGGDDIPAELAAQYGYVNRLVPGAEIEGVVDGFARRIASFDYATTRPKGCPSAAVSPSTQTARLNVRPVTALRPWTITRAGGQSGGAETAPSWGCAGNHSM